MRSLLMAITVAATVAACAKTEPAAHVDAGLVRVSTDRVLKTGSVGGGQWETQATYVLVDAENTSGQDLLVTLGGTLVDGAAGTVGDLRAESLYVPRGARRTFALVDRENRARPAAKDAQVTVLGAIAPRWRPSVTIKDTHLYDDHGKPFLIAHVTNDVDAAGKVIVFAGFQDADGRPMARPFQLVEMGKHVTQVVQFSGPPGAKSAYMFLGDTQY